ncbi:MAG TPA: AI-2E family transporter [Candidatus Limnocylindrales bacterium]|nr:AI-2E family transporter [Candidatus Limnocylindrales bacterium]
MFHQFIKYLLKNQVIFALFIIASIWFVVQTREIIVSIFLSYIIMAAVLPMVEYLRKRGVNKVVAVLIPYFGIIIAIFLLILPLVPFVANQIQSLVTNFPKFIDRSADVFGVSINPKQIERYISTEFETFGKSAFNVTTKVFGGLFSIITVAVVSLYFLMYEDTFKRFVANLFHKDAREKALVTLDQINFKLGAWLRGQIQLCVFIGLFSWIGLTILGLPYALPLALFAGLLEVVPTIGPILSSIPAIVIALTISPTKAMAVVTLYVLIQAVENQILVPKVMQKAVGLNPVVVILGIMIGTNLMGISGALLAIPFISFIVVLFKSLESKN